MLSPILSVHDIDASISYYTNKLGFLLNWRLTDDQEQATFASITLSENEILLGTIDFVPQANRGKLGISVQFHLTLGEEANIDRLYETARDAGAVITRELEDREWGERAFVVNDLDGYIFMIAQSFSKPPESQQK